MWTVLPVRRTAYLGPDPSCGAGSTSAVSPTTGGTWWSAAMPPTRAAMSVGYVVVDASTGQEVRLPVSAPPGSSVRQVAFRPGGGLVIVTDHDQGTATEVSFVSA